MIAFVVAGVALVLVARKPAGRTFLWRYFSGAHLDGRRRSNCGFWSRGLRPAATDISGRASAWAKAPRYQRILWRVGIPGALIGVGVGIASAPLLTVVVGSLAGAGLTAWGSWAWALPAIRLWRHRRAWVHPVHRALAPMLGMELSRATEWVHVPEKFHDGEHEIVLDLPDDFTGITEAKRRVQEIVVAKLALEDPGCEFRMVGRPKLVIRAETPPPARVTLEDALPHIAALPETALLAGLGRKSRPITFDLLTDSPHGLISGSSGSGKSVLVRAFTAQGLHNGGIALVLDVKRISQAWARGLANTMVARDIATIHDALLWVRTEIDRRTLIADQYTDENGDLAPGVDIGPRLWIVAEEFNAMSKRLAGHWRKIKPKGAPPTSPAVEALADALYMGRALSINTISTAQLATMAAIGDSAMRECMGWRAVSRFTIQAWRMLAGGISSMPPKLAKHLGRWLVMTGDGEAHAMQALWMTPAEARKYAMSGTVSVFPDMDGGHDADLDTPRSTTTPEPAGVPSVALVGAPGDRLVGLAEACESGILTVGIVAARSARARDPEWPAGVGKRGQEILYAASALERWERNRPMAKVGDEQ